MKIIKKKTNKIKVEEAGVPFIPPVAEFHETPPKPKLTEFSVDFGREDLNSLRNKVNEIIAFINAF